MLGRRSRKPHFLLFQIRLQLFNSSTSSFCHINIFLFSILINNVNTFLVQSNTYLLRFRIISWSPSPWTQLITSLTFGYHKYNTFGNQKSRGLTKIFYLFTFCCQYSNTPKLPSQIPTVTSASSCIHAINSLDDVSSK